MPDNDLKDLLMQQVKVKVAQLQHWESVQWQGGRLYYETTRILNEISDYNVATQIMYLQLLAEQKFTIQDNTPSAAPIITGEFLNWVNSRIIKLKVIALQQEKPTTEIENITSLEPSTVDIPTVFISYSHDSDEHKAWVKRLALRLRSNGIDVILDQFNLRLGNDLPSFMEQGLSKSHRVLCICSDNYVRKANKPEGGTGYEKLIITAKLLKNIDSAWVIPVIRNNSGNEKTPTFLDGKVYIDFRDEANYNDRYIELISELHDEPVNAIPELGPNPFKATKAIGKNSVKILSEQYWSHEMQGTVTFNYSNNNGQFVLGNGKFLFESCWSKGGTSSIHVYSDAESVISVAHAHGVEDIVDIKDATQYDTSSRARLIYLNQIVILQNIHGYYAAIKVINIEVRDWNKGADELTFEYKIQANGSGDFSNDLDA
jgi:hypothetical protein